MSKLSTVSNWSKFDKAFSQVSAYVVLDRETKEVIAKIALKYPKDGAGRLSCYMHIVGSEVQIGIAGGYGYDKRTSAIIDAGEHCLVLATTTDSMTNRQLDFITLLNSTKAQGGWQEVINEQNGFLVIQAI